MTVYTLNPLHDPRWDELARNHPAASVFHTPGWLQALQRTYGYEPVVYTTCPPDTPLTNGIVVCGVRSWLTGHRLVSVPFADHCAPLVDSPTDLTALLDALHAETAKEWKYVELRPANPVSSNEPFVESAAVFRLHMLDLRPGLEQIYRRMHASTIQRKIRRAEREGLSYEEGRSEALLNSFYRLLVLTRRRHSVPPPPLRWFSNLMECVGDAAKIRVASKDGRAVGSILTLDHGATLVYKYGCSDATVHNLGAMPFLFWRAIEDAKARGLQVLDLGRSDVENAGLITFKERLGGVPSTLTYLRCSARPLRRGHMTSMRLPARVFTWLPDPLVVIAGRVLYRHIA